MKNKLTAIIGLIVVAVIWGSNFGVTKWAMSDFEPLVFVVLRFVLSVPVFFILLKITEGSVLVARRDMLRLLIIGFVGVTMLEMSMIYSINYTTLTNSSLLNVAPWPIFAALLSPLFTKERITKHMIIGGAAALVGVSLVILGGNGGFHFESEHLIGDLLALFVSFIGALYNLASMPLMSRYSPLRVSAWTILFGTIFIIPFALSSWGKMDWSSVSGVSWVAIGYNVILCTVVAFIVWNACMKTVGTTRANFFRYLVPAAAVLVGYLMFEETMSVTQWMGALCMGAGLIWISSEKVKDENVSSAQVSVGQASE